MAAVAGALAGGVALSVRWGATALGAGGDASVGVVSLRIVGAGDLEASSNAAQIGCVA